MVFDFGEPLDDLVRLISSKIRRIVILTFARTFSKEAGPTTEKQMRKMSVCG